MDRHDNAGYGLLPRFALGTLVPFFLAWAAMHDIAHGETDCTLEYAALTLSLVAFALLYRKAVRLLSPNTRAAWLGGTGLLVVLFDLAAFTAMLNPRYDRDRLLGSLFLMVGLPLLGLIGSHLVRGASRLRARR